MNLLKILIFKDSRKVGMGLWLFILANLWLFKHLISADDWMMVMALSSGLVGGGTVMDRYLSYKSGSPVKPPSVP